MKRIAAFLSLLTVLVSLAFADIHPRYRNVELGFDVSASAQQNLFTVNDILTDVIKIDFTDMANGLGNKNLAFSTNWNADAFFDLKIGFLSFGIYANLLDVTAGLSVSKDLFELLGKGNKLDEDMVFSLGARLEAFSTFSVPVGVDLGKIKVKVTPSLFIPLLYMPSPEMGVKFRADSETGDIEGKAFLNGNIYTVFGFGNFTGSELPELDPMDILSNFGSYFGNAGFDINAAAEYELFDFLDVGGYVNCPIVPGRLNYGLEIKKEMELPFSSVQDFLNSADPDSGGGDGGDDGDAFSGISGQNFKVNRPFRLGVEASYRPFGKWFALRPALGIAVRNPFGDDGKFSKEAIRLKDSRFYAEYSLNVDMRLLYFLCLNFTTSYQNQIYTQEAGIGFNLKVVELDANIASSGTSFGKSFGLGGVKAKVALKVGF